MPHRRCFLQLTILPAILLGVCSVLAGQETPSPNQNTQPAPAPRWHFGSEIDTLPYILGGYYGSLFVGHNDWRWRAVAARSDVPSFLVPSGFEKKRSDAYALITDHFFGSRRRHEEGFWIGGGGEFWRRRIRPENVTNFTYYNNFALTAGGGYVWKLSQHVYLNPWGDAHAVAAGNTNINVSGKTYKEPRITPEASLKLGFVF